MIQNASQARPVGLSGAFGIIDLLFRVAHTGLRAAFGVSSPSGSSLVPVKYQPGGTWGPGPPPPRSPPGLGRSEDPTWQPEPPNHRLLLEYFSLRSWDSSIQ